MKKFQAIVALLLLTTVQVVAEEHLVMHFDFENVSGKDVTDPVSGITAKVMNQAKVVEMGNRHVLELGNGTGYMNMTKNAGTIVKELEDFTVSVYYRVDAAASLSGAGYFLWCFSQSAANTQTSAPYTAYRLNAQRMATSTGGWGNEVGMEVGSESAKGCWMHMLYRQSGQKGELFINGMHVTQATNMPVLKNTLSAVPEYNWIGRAPFSDDSYLKQTLVADFRLYDVSISDAEVASLAAVTELLDEEYKYGTPGDFSVLKTVVDKAKTFIAGATIGYAPNAIAELQDEVTVAEYEIASARASQALIDEYVNELNSLLTNAKATRGYTAKNVMVESSDHGFVHPGGIVSQEDIDRAKRLLAEGNTRIKAAWNILCTNEYAQSGVQTYPVETIVRGGSGTQNYMNVARGAAMAFQNALRWKIGGTRANADAAVRILMAWARGNKWVSGDTNLSLAAGIYGHQLANAAELMRDYDGWSKEDFEEFRQYMIKTWYNPSIDFLRRRHDTWLNARNASLGERPGHYWSNWGLCNALCVMSIGILCDDVHMYNQGVSFYKYDHVGTYNDRSSYSMILNDGCDEFIGNLVPVVHKDERGALGYLGQMQESGRDQGHALMALGLALDICQVGLNQGDDLFAYMNDRIAAGTEFVAAMNFGGVDATSLPWTNYNYADCRGRMGAGWLQEGPNPGGQGEYRPYWDRAIGYYEGMRGVKLQYAEQASAKICPDGGGGNYSQNSGGFDHLGFSTLSSWRPAISVEEAITPLSGDMIYKGVTYKNQTNLGGLKYNYEVCQSKGIPADGSDITLIPQLPKGAEDSGQWQWNTGETTRQITVKADHSYIYRVTYIAQNGAVSHQAFAIAVSGDAAPDKMTEEITVDGVIERVTEKAVIAGTSVILYAGSSTGWTDDYLWDNGQKSSVIVIPSIMQSREYLCQYANQSGAVSESRFRLNVIPAEPYIIYKDMMLNSKEITVAEGSTLQLGLNLPLTIRASDVEWSTGDKGALITLNDIQTSNTYTASFTLAGKEVNIEFEVYVRSTTDYSLESGNYMIQEIKSGRLLTAHGSGEDVTFEPGDTESPAEGQIWFIEQKFNRHAIISLPDSLGLLTSGKLGKTKLRNYYMEQPIGSEQIAVRTGARSASNTYWHINDDGTITINSTLSEYPLCFIPFDVTTDVVEIEAKEENMNGTIYDLQGRRINGTPKHGIYIINGKKVLVK